MNDQFGQHLTTLLFNVDIIFGGEAIDEVLSCFDAGLRGGECFANVVVEVAWGWGGGAVGCSGEEGFVGH